ncbi:MAG: cupin domain-containing protein [Gammaproteobacteria bacterium]|nr:cupin domain-containing protein [Gammaproteobacteria bacterium]
MSGDPRCVRDRDVTAFVAKDGSRVRELMHPRVHGNRAQSLAEATIAAGCTTRLHRHRCVEELYYVLEGQGLMCVGAGEWVIGAGDTVLIPPGAPHKIRALGTTDLRLLCVSAPAYSDDDTELL